MNKSITLIFTSFILLSLASAKSKQQRAKAKIQAQFNAPTHFSDCSDQVYSVALKALNEAKRDKTLSWPFIPPSASSLSVEGCKYAHTNYDWVQLTYEEGQKICTLYLVVGWLNWATHPDMFQRDSSKYTLYAGQTALANEKFAQCIDKPKEEEHPKIVIDVEEKDEEIFEDSKGDLVEEEEDVFEQDELSIDDSYFYQDDDNETNTNADDTNTHKDDDNKHEDKKDDDKKDGELKEEVVQPTWGPARTAFPSHNQHGSANPEDRNEPESNEDDQEDISESMHNLFNQNLGGWEKCSAEDIPLARQVVSMLIAQDKISGITIYEENVSECRKQIVNGTNYNVAISINRKVCQLSFHKEIRGELSELNSAPSLGMPRCTDVYGPNQ